MNRESSRPAGASRRRVRGPRKGVPAQKQRRDAMLSAVRRYVRKAGLVPPLSMDELASHAARALADEGFDESCADYASILLNNETWLGMFAAVPFGRRLLLLPQCLRNRRLCAAKIDGFGLLCASCGGCVVCDLKARAQRLGYVVLVAEGTAVVTSLIAAGKIEAILGVSCMAMLERVFPYTQAAAIPAIAIPLLYDGCEDTALDVDWLDELLYLAGDEPAMRLNLDALRREVESWFAPGNLAVEMGDPRGPAEKVARDFLARAGKRWRPVLTVCAHQAMLDDPSTPVPEKLRKIAIAVECFHKASLIHDDIEDGDAERGGVATLHESLGVGIALNAGDLLLGEGYRLIAESDFPAPVRARMLRAAAGGHRTLCIGQGDELEWVRNPRPLSSGEVLDIFRKKTAPAFEVALRLGGLAAGANDETLDILGGYSEHLGIAYQIRDDLEDLDSPGQTAAKLRPSILLAMAYDWATGPGKQKIGRIWQPAASRAAVGELRNILDDLGVIPAAGKLLIEHKTAAMEALRPLAGANLKCLLRRMLSRIFDDVAMTDWCGDTETTNDAGGGARRE